MKTRFIVNLRSGGARRALPAVQRHAARHGATLVLTEHARHAFDLAAAARTEGVELVVAVGGDGTMNEVATALVDTPVTLGLVPAGSGDGLGRHLRIHGPVERALSILASGRTQVIDTGVADGHAFFCAAGVGFEAYLADRFNRLTRRGFARYLTTGARALPAYQPETYEITDAAGTQTVRAFTLVVANAGQYGNNARIAPRARIDDGLLDLCAVPPLSPWNALPLAARLFGGSVDACPGVVARQAARFVIRRASPGLLHTDGEVHTAGTEIEFSVRPASLRVRVPAAGLERDSLRRSDGEAAP